MLPAPWKEMVLPPGPLRCTVSDRGLPCRQQIGDWLVWVAAVRMARTHVQRRWATGTYTHARLGWQTSNLCAASYPACLRFACQRLQPLPLVQLFRAAAEWMGKSCRLATQQQGTAAMQAADAYHAAEAADWGRLKQKQALPCVHVMRSSSTW